MAAVTFENAIDQFIDGLLASAQDGLTWTEFAGGLIDLGKHASEAAANYLVNSGERKKEAVKAAIMQGFDALWPLVALNSPWLAMLLRPIARQIVATALDAAVERIYQWAVKPNLPATE